MAAHAVLAIKLAKSGLHRTYRIFFAYLIFRAFRSSLLMLLPTNRSTYAWGYFITEPVLWLLYVGVLLELYTLAFREFRGITTLARWVTRAALAGAVLLSVLSLAPDLNSPHPYPYIHLFTVLGRAICSSLALFLLAVSLFLVLYPVPLSRNVIVHSVVYSVYFLTLTLAYFVHNVFGPQTLPVVNFVLLAVASLALGAWIILLTPAGEKVVVSSRRQWDPEEEARLVRQLDSINATLLRVARK